MKAAVENLPDEASALKKIIAEQQLKLSNQAQQINSKERCIALLEEFIRLQRHRQFGASSEKAAGQAELFKGTSKNPPKSAIIISLHYRLWKSHAPQLLWSPKPPRTA